MDRSVIKYGNPLDGTFSPYAKNVLKNKLKDKKKEKIVYRNYLQELKNSPELKKNKSMKSFKPKALLKPISKEV